MNAEYKMKITSQLTGDTVTLVSDGNVIASGPLQSVIDHSIAVERERCAKIAEDQWSPESNALGPEYILRHKIAAQIRSGK